MRDFLGKVAFAILLGIGLVLMAGLCWLMAQSFAAAGYHR